MLKIVGGLCIIAGISFFAFVVGVNPLMVLSLLLAGFGIAMLVF